MYIRVVGVVKKNNSLLMIRRKDETQREHYIFPSGHWEFPEKFSIGAIRETFEETGVQTTLNKFFTMSINWQRGCLEVYYLLNCIEPNLNKLSPSNPIDLNTVDFIPMYIPIDKLIDIRVKNKGMKKIVDSLAKRNN